jgi:hypothetical protein
LKTVQVENIKNESELKNFIHFSWKFYEYGPGWISLQFMRRGKLTFRDVKGR